MNGLPPGPSKLMDTRFLNPRMAPSLPCFLLRGGHYIVLSRFLLPATPDPHPGFRRTPPSYEKCRADFLTVLGVVACCRARGGRTGAGSPRDVNRVRDGSCVAWRLCAVVLIGRVVDGCPRGSCGSRYCPCHGRG